MHNIKPILALLAVTRIMSSLDIVVVVLAGVVSVVTVVLFLCHVKPPVGSRHKYVHIPLKDYRKDPNTLL